MKTTLTHRNVLTCEVPWTGGEWLLLSDIHIDSKHCRKDLLLKHLQEAKERGAKVAIFGDLFDAMQGKWDARGTKSDLIDEVQGSNYLDLVVEYAIETLGPYKDCIELITPGNHETSIKKRHETDLIERTVDGLNLTKEGSRVYSGGYSGWIRFIFWRSNKTRGTRTLAYHHGYGGGGVVSRGIIQHNRHAASRDTDIMVYGHIHESWMLTNMRAHLTSKGYPSIREQFFICCPGYKEEYGDGHEGWHIETGKPPKPTGGWWMKWICRHNSSLPGEDSNKIWPEFQQAK